MSRSQTYLATGIVILLLLLSSAATWAQESTSEPMATSEPNSVGDARINGNIYFSDLALYCFGEKNDTNVQSFDNGGITVWGGNGEEYIVLTAAQLRGDAEVPQPQLTVEPGMTGETMVSPTPMATEAMMMEPVLLARAMTAFGPIWFYRVDANTFALQSANIADGKLYTYTWTDCNRGTLSTEVLPYGSTTLPGTPMATMEVSSGSLSRMSATETPVIVTMPTTEVTPVATTP